MQKDLFVRALLTAFLLSSTSLAELKTSTAAASSASVECGTSGPSRTDRKAKGKQQEFLTVVLPEVWMVASL